MHFPSKKQSAITLVSDTAQNLVAQSIPLLKDHPHLSAGSLHFPDTGKLKGFAASIIDEIWHAGCFDWIIVEADGARQLPIKASNTHEPVIPSSTTAIIHVTGLDALNTPLDDHHVHRSAIFSDNTGLAPGQRVNIRAMAASCVLEIRKARALAGSSPAAVAWFNKADNRPRISAGHAVAASLKKDRQDYQDNPAPQGCKSLPHHRARPTPWPGRVVIASLADPDPIKGVVTL
ncbi:MAG: putative selenium-dependent hydroxylase accessory protein YqeC [Desulfobacteraceae bacterium]|nr:putative selenium-dependent hydroxylase accessory protein YqeC [Desulfobacteraceae bacterium]